MYNILKIFNEIIKYICVCSFVFFMILVIILSIIWAYKFNLIFGLFLSCIYLIIIYNQIIKKITNETD